MQPRNGRRVADRRNNPIKSAPEWGLMQAAASGVAHVKGISQQLAEEMIHRTPKNLRSKFAKELARIRANNPKQKTFVITYAPFNIVREAGVFYDKEQAKSWAKQANRIDPNYRGKGLKVSELDDNGYPKDWRMKKNPSEDEDIKLAEGVSEEWHGRKSKEIVEIDEIEKYEDTGAILADLEELGILGSDFATRYTITFKSDRPKLCSDLKKENLEIVGGDQGIDIDIDLSKNKVPLGYCYSIVYETDKHHLEGSNGYPESYEHFFGEEYYKSCGYSQDDYKTSDDFFDDLLEDGIVEDAIGEGYLPVAMYDRVNEKLSLVGGRYSIEDVGIKD
jgi:hypothetical protein